MDEPRPEPMLTMRDIADLAQVKRAVVSMWRRRPRVRGEDIPFPEPVAVVGRAERFRREEIVAWLERTGRGNNPQHELDARAAGMPDDVALEDLVTLLCLQVCTGRELAELSVAECAELAGEADPGDRMLASEVAALTAGREVRTYIDDLLESTYGPADALERLETGRAGRSREARELTDRARLLLRWIVDTCRTELDPEGAQLVSSGEEPGLVLELVGDDGVIAVLGEDAAARALRRRATIREVRVAETAAGPRVRLVSLVGSDTDEALDRMDDVLVGLESEEIAVVIGSAAALCDELRGDQEKRRSATLRIGGLALALRLPRGLWREAHRQALGVWIVVGGTGIDTPLVADLAAPVAVDLDLEALAADIAGALTQSGRRSYRYARPRPRSDMLAGQSVVPHGYCADRLRTSDPIADIDRVHAATLITSAAPPALDVLVQPAVGALKTRHRSLSHLHDNKLVRVSRGCRVNLVHATAAGTVPVHSADHTTAGYTLDPLDAEKHYGRATRTQPGDIVFTHTPRPLAWVDHLGGGIVASPSRILRVDPSAGFGPRVLAWLINQLPAQVQEWKTWNVPVLESNEARLLEDVLEEIDRYEAELRRRLTASAELGRALVEGVAAGTVSLRVTEKIPS